jgi:hypothetical protein
MARSSLDPTKPADRLRILSHPTRFALASLCEDAPQTIPAMALTLNMRDGAIRNTVKQMHRWTVLQMDSAKGPRPRAVYSLAPSWLQDLKKARATLAPFQLRVGQRLLFVGFRAVGSLEHDDVIWSVDFGHQNKSLLALFEDASDPPKGLALLLDSGATVELLEVTALHSPH